MSNNNDQNPRRVSVEVSFPVGSNYLPNILLRGKTVSDAVDVVKAVCRDRLTFLCFSLAILAKNPGSRRGELEEFADALIEHMNQPHGIGFKSGYYIQGFDGIRYRRPPDTRPKHRRLPKPQKGRRTKWTPEYQDAVPKIIKAARSENWKGLTSN